MHSTVRIRIREHEIRTKTKLIEGWNQDVPQTSWGEVFLATPVESTRVSAQQPFHPGDQIGQRRLDHDMKMIRHEDIGVNLPARLGANLAQRFDEALAIRIIHEDQFAPVTAIHDVINPASLLDSQLADQTGGVALAALHINTKN